MGRGGARIRLQDRVGVKRNGCLVRGRTRLGKGVWGKTVSTGDGHEGLWDPLRKRGLLFLKEAYVKKYQGKLEGCG